MKGYGSIGRAAARAAEVFTIRAAPGLINLAALFILSDKLGSDDFGYYSTTIASAGMLGLIVLGPILYGIIPEAGEHGNPKKYARYVGLIMSSVLGLLMTGALAATILPFLAAAIIATVASAALAVMKELLRSQLRFWSWGATSIGQAALFIASVWHIPLAIGSDTAVWLFSLSNFLAALLAYALLGFPLPSLRRRNLLRQNVKIGGTYTLSNIFESLFGLATRYLVAFFGSPELLSTFSLCLDVAERLIGFLVSAAGFLTVPMAFKRRRTEGQAAFLATLRRGSTWGGLAALASMGALLILHSLEWLPGPSQEMLDPAMLFWVGTAVTVNRLKKISIDPAAMKAGRTGVILKGYMLAGPPTLVLQAAFLPITYAFVGPILLCGYIAASAFAWRGYSRLPSEGAEKALST